LSDTILKGDHPGPFHQSLVEIGPVVLEELIKMQKANDGRRTTDAGRRTPSGSNSSHDPSGQVS